MKKIHIRFIAPSWYVDREEFSESLKLLPEEFVPHYSETIFNRQMNLAGNDKRRLDEIKEAFLSEENIIWAARGGYGLSRLLGKLDIPSGNKILIGYSDITLLGMEAVKMGHRFVYGAMPHTFSRQKPGLDSIIGLLRGKKTRKIPVVNGKAEEMKGRAAVFCLKLLINTLGTPFEPRLEKDHILFIEDVDERAYAIERDLTQLKYCGITDNIKGIVFNFHSIRGKGEADPVNWMRKHIKAPILGEASFGHTPEAMPIIFNEEVSVEKDHIFLSGNTGH